MPTPSIQAPSIPTPPIPTPSIQARSTQARSTRAGRDRRDRCPGALRPWPAEDGLLVRLRLIGGQITSMQLRALAQVARDHGDGHVHVTSRANLQLRAFPGTEGSLTDAALTAIDGTGLLPSRTHELVRNIMFSPQSGLAGGRADLRPLGGALDELICSDPRMAQLPGKFLIVLDDGHGDLRDHPADLGLVVLDADTAQLRIGRRWGPVVVLADAASALIDCAARFLDVRGNGPSAPWHIDELDQPLTPSTPPDPRLPEPAMPLPFGEVPGGEHVEVPDTGLDAAMITALTAGIDHLVVTPWRGVLVPGRHR